MTQNKKNKYGKGLNLFLIILFFATFSITILVINLFFKHYSVPVDVSIGNNSEAEEIEKVEEEEYTTLGQHDVDDRLKWIQYEDNNTETSVSKYSGEIKEKDSQNKKEKQKENTEEHKYADVPIPVLEPIKLIEPENVLSSLKHEVNENNEETITQAIQPVANVTPKEEPVTVTRKITRVYVGFYNTREDAQESLSKITSSISGFSPYVKGMNGKYIVQIASFTDRDKAVNLKTELVNKGFSARLLSD